MNISSPVTNPVTSLAVAPAILAAANLLLPHLERGQRVDAAVLRSAMETTFGRSDATGAWDWKLALPAMPVEPPFGVAPAGVPALGGTAAGFELKIDEGKEPREQIVDLKGGL